MLSNSGVADMMQIVYQFLIPLEPILMIIVGIGIGIQIVRVLAVIFGNLTIVSDEKLKRSIDEITAEKPKRLTGDDGELFHPIEEYFEPEGPNHG